MWICPKCNKEHADMDLVVIAERGDIVHYCRYCHAEMNRFPAEIKIPEIKTGPKGPGVM